MNQQLLDAIKKRKKQMGGPDDEPAKEQKQAPKPAVHAQNFNQNKKMLEDLFGKKSEPAPVAPKEIIQGDQQGFNNAKALLQKQFGAKGNTNVMNVQGNNPTMVGIANLPPPLPPMASLNLPPPPPPPMFDLPLPPLNLPPPPPPMSGLNLPPPPSLNTINLPPPPSLSAVLNNGQSNTPPPNIQPKLVPTNNLPPPPVNLPPPPSINLPPPPINLPPPINRTPPPINNNVSPSINFNIPPPNTSQNSSARTPIFNGNTPPPTPNFPPPPPPPPTNNQPIHHHHQQQPQQQTNIPAKNIQINSNNPPQEDACFILSSGSSNSHHQQQPNQNKVPTVTAWEKQDLQKSKKKRIFDKKTTKKYPLTEQFFGKNLGLLIKQQFQKSVNILGTIDKQVKKTMYNFNFPSIENKVRNIQAIQTLYADTDNLDLVSCYMTKNLNAVKVHNEQREQFVSQIQGYNWETDNLKLKPIRESASQFPNSSYTEPNFVQINNSFKRLDNLIKNLANQQDFGKCAKLKGLKQQTQNMLSAYLNNPQNNPNLLQRIDANVAQMKTIQA